jgi:hypothetical protein
LARYCLGGQRITHCFSFILSVRLVFAAQAVRVGFHLCRQSNLSYNRKYYWYDITIGQAYVNVHTEQNSDGEIRGTIEVDLD